jgi:stage IV sporulation protein FB
VLLAEPNRTAYDFHFQIFGFPVRVTPFFWVAAAVIGWGASISAGDSGASNNPGQGVFLILWIASMFVSILIHELGHSLAMRYYGIPSSIVLYHFGGLAIPDSFSSFGRMSKLRARENQLVISAAGPVAQLLLAAAVILGVEAAGYRFAETIWPLERFVPVSSKPYVPSYVAFVVLSFLAGPSIYWALLNLVPVYPLDGGQISRELFIRFGSRNAIRDSLSLSLFTAIGCAVYGYSSGEPFLAMLFVSLAVSSYQLLQMFRFGGGGGPW